MRNPAAWAAGLLPGLVLLVCGAAPEPWVFDRAAVAGGELWRLLTAHFVHVDATHALANGLGAALVVLALGRPGARRLVFLLCGGAVGVNAALWWWPGGPQLYCGLSGALNGMLVGGLMDAWFRSRSPLYLAAAAVWLVKILAEQATGGSIVLASPWPSWPAAHVAGALGGMAAASVSSLCAAETPSVVRSAPSIPVRS